MPNVDTQEHAQLAVSFWRRTRNIVRAILLVWLAVLVLTVGPTLLRISLQHIYTPPALTQDKLETYRDFVAFVRSPDIPSEISLDYCGHLGSGSRYSDLHNPNVSSLLIGQHEVSTMEITKLRVMAKAFRRIGCEVAWKRGDAVLFVQQRNWILPTSPGVLYALDGQNPNESNDPEMVARKPFIPIAQSWYLSRNLVSSDHGRSRRTLPTAWWDRSRQTEHLQASALTIDNSARTNVDHFGMGNGAPDP